MTGVDPWIDHVDEAKKSGEGGRDFVSILHPHRNNRWMWVDVHSFPALLFSPLLVFRRTGKIRIILCGGGQVLLFILLLFLLYGGYG